MENNLSPLLSKGSLIFISIYSLFFLVYFIKNDNFKRDGKLFALTFFNFLNYIFLNIFLNADIAKDSSIVAFSTLVVFSFLVGFYFYKGINIKNIRWLYRGYFAFSIFLFPIFILDIDDIKNICIGLIVSYLLSAAINRYFFGQFPESDRKSNAALWLKCGEDSFFSDMLKFRSEFSLNTPGGHRQILESFYPYFISIFSIVLVSIYVLNISKVRLDYALSVIDNSLLGQIVSYDKITNKNALDINKLDQSSLIPGAEEIKSKTITAETNRGNLLLLEVEKRPNRSLFQWNNRDPAKISDSLTQSMDMITLRNFIFILLLLVTAWVLNSRDLKNSYIDKWKLLNDELLQLYGEHKVEEVALRRRKILFACNLIVTEMWGHRSFGSVFVKILEELYPKEKITDNNYKMDDLLEKLQATLLET